VINEEGPSSSSSLLGNDKNISPLVQIFLQTKHHATHVLSSWQMTRSQNNIFKPKVLFQVAKYPLAEMLNPPMPKKP